MMYESIETVVTIKVWRQNAKKAFVLLDKMVADGYEHVGTVVKTDVPEDGCTITLKKLEPIRYEQAQQ